MLENKTRREYREKSIVRYLFHFAVCIDVCGNVFEQERAVGSDRTGRGDRRILRRASLDGA